jgi:hypothetical protein
MVQLNENKDPRPFLMNYFSHKLAGCRASSLRRGRASARRAPSTDNGVRKLPRRVPDHRKIPASARNSTHYEIRDPKLSGRSLTILLVAHPSRLRSSRRMAVFEFLGSQRVLRRSNGLPGSSSLLRQRLAGRTPRARAHSVAPSYQPALRLASTSRLIYRRTLRGLSQTNLPALDGSGS